MNTTKNLTFLFKTSLPTKDNLQPYVYYNTITIYHILHTNLKSFLLYLNAYNLVITNPIWMFLSALGSLCVAGVSPGRPTSM